MEAPKVTDRVGALKRFDSRDVLFGIQTRPWVGGSAQTDIARVRDGWNVFVPAPSLQSMETDAELLEVTDSFQISGWGLVVLPDFPVPIAWLGRTVPARILRPDGSEIHADLSLYVSHFNIRDPSAPLDKRWRVTPKFPLLVKDEVPLCSLVFVESDVVSALVGSLA